MAIPAASFCGEQGIHHGIRRNSFLARTGTRGQSSTPRLYVAFKGPRTAKQIAGGRSHRANYPQLRPVNRAGAGCLPAPIADGSRRHQGRMPSVCRF